MKRSRLNERAFFCCTRVLLHAVKKNHKAKDKLCGAFAIIGFIVLVMSEITEEELVKRRVPALIAYLNPFRIIENDDASEPWSASIRFCRQRGIG